MKLKNRFIGGSVLSYNNLKGLFYPFLVIPIFTFLFGSQSNLGSNAIPNSMDMDYFNSLPQQELEDFIGSRDLGLVALVQNGNAWGSDAWQTVLESHSISYEILPTSSLLTMDYSQYDFTTTH